MTDSSNSQSFRVGGAKRAFMVAILTRPDDQAPVVPEGCHSVVLDLRDKWPGTTFECDIKIDLTPISTTKRGSRK